MELQIVEDKNTYKTIWASREKRRFFSTVCSFFSQKEGMKRRVVNKSYRDISCSDVAR